MARACGWGTLVRGSEPAATPDCNVDCFGEFCRDELSVTAAGTRFHFVYAANRKPGRRYSLGLFLNDTALHPACFRYPRRRRVALLLESPIRGIFARPELLQQRYRHVFTYHRQLLERGEPYVPFYYGVSWVGAGVAPQTFQKTRLLSFIGSLLHGDVHGYSLRRAVAQRLMEGELADCFGRGIRDIEDKVAGLAEYGFSVAMENFQQDYYFTEKLIDCFLTETVPVYWGCPGIGDVFDERGILRFETLDDLMRIVRELSFERYQAMLPYVLKNKQTVLENGWTGYEGLYSQLAQQLASRIDVHGQVHPWHRGKPMAALRWAANAAMLERVLRRTAAG